MQTAQAQSGLNTNTAITQNLLNMTNQVGPWGSTTYNPTGTQSYTDSSGKTVTLPQYTQTTQYSPEQQAIFDKTTAAQTNIADIAAQQSDSLKGYLNSGFKFDNGSTFNAPTATAPTPFSFDNGDAQNWAYDLGSQRILPQQREAQAALETQLTNKGIRPGTQAWNSEMERLGRTNTDQLNQLALTGRQQAFGEAQGTWQGNANTSLSAQNLGFNQALQGRQQNFQEAVTGRNQPLNEISALLSGSQIANPNSGFSATPQAQVGGVDYTGLVNNNYNQKVASSNAMLGGLFGLAGSAATAGIKYG